MYLGRVLWMFALLASLSCASSAQQRALREAPPGEPASLAYADLGSGKPVVLVHGAYGDLRTFGPALPLLAAEHRVVVPSLRYHWPNPWPSTDEEVYRTYTAENHARDLAALIERLGTRPVDLVAHSYGGNIAVILALQHPDLVRRLVLLEPAVGWMLREVPGGEEILAKGAYAGSRREVLVSRARGGEDPVSVMRSLIDGDKPGTFDALPAQSRVELVENARLVGAYATRPAFEIPFTCDDARRIRQPLLLVRGEKTGDAFRQIVARFAACVPDARTVVLPGSGHMMGRDAPEALARSVLEFLGK